MRKPYANNNGTDQSAHPHGLISTFVVRCLDSTSKAFTKKACLTVRGYNFTEDLDAG